MSIEPGPGVSSRSSSQVSLPHVSSVYPLRRNVNMESAEQKNARKEWQATLKERLGSPGRPPGPEALPSLYERRGPAVSGTLLSKSIPPSSIGPSASIVAWFAQFQCEQCGRIPTSVDARFCVQCGHRLSIPLLPGAGGVSGASNVQATPPRRAASPAGKAAVRGRSSEPAQNALGAVRTRSCAGLEGRGGCESERGGGARPPRPALSQAAPSEPGMAWSARESKVAVWLGNVKPRRH